MKKILIVMVLVILMSFPTTIHAETTEPTLSDYERMFIQVLEFIKEGYIYGEQLSEKQLFEAAMKGMFSELDIYSEFMTATEGQEFTNSLSSSYVGIGVQLTQSGDYIKITKVFKNSPAERAGIKKGDYFISVNGVDTKGFTTQQILSHVLGEEGTSVNIVFGRGGTTFNTTLERSKVVIPTVERIPITDLYDGLTESEAKEIEYIYLSSFSEKTDIDFKEAIKEAQESGAKYLILDMRDNGGGYVSTAVNVAKMIVPKGPIVYFENADGTERVYSSTLEEAPFEITVLVNEYSASATEFVAGAIKDSGVGELVGETTFGKGVAQFMFDYEFDYKLKLTMEEFFTRDKNQINKIGVDPNYFVEIPDYLLGDARFFINDQKTEVIGIEKILNHLGYNVGSPDNLFDLKTFDAIKKFQIDQGLYGYGVCDFTTQLKLNEALQKAIEAKDPQLNTAVGLVLNKIHKN